MATAHEIIQRLDLKPHREGGYFAEVWRSPDKLAVNALPPRYSGSRSLSTSIYYLLTADTFSRMHRLRSDEVFHFYLGDPVEMLLLGHEQKGAGVQGGKGPGGHGRVVVLGPDIEAGQLPQVVVPRGVWQGAGLKTRSKGAFALMGTTTAPGFEYDDYQEGERGMLVKEYPDFAAKICELTG